MPPPKSGKDYNNSSRQSYECPPPPGPAQTLFAWVEPGRGGGARSATGGGANTRPAVIAKERETLKTLAYDCGNPVQYVCGHPPAVPFFIYWIATVVSLPRDDKWD